jgi:hypothetical protein
MKKVYELSPNNGRKSFYGKAKVIVDIKTGEETLYSYDIPIVKIKGNKIIYEDEDGKKQKKKLSDEEWAEIYGTQQGTKDMQEALRNLP